MEDISDFNKNIISENSYENKNIQESLPFDNNINSDIKKIILPELKFLRSEIDNIDDQLLELIVKRTSIVDDIGAIKNNQNNIKHILHLFGGPRHWMPYDIIQLKQKYSYPYSIRHLHADNVASLASCAIRSLTTTLYQRLTYQGLPGY